MPQLRCVIDFSSVDDLSDVAVDDLARELTAILRELPDTIVSFGNCAPSPITHAKGIDAGAISQIVTLLSSSGTLAALVKLLQVKSHDKRVRSISIKIGEDSLEIRGTREPSDQELIDEWLSRHTGSDVN
jgi:hypothetical protein